MVRDVCIALSRMLLSDDGDRIPDSCQQVMLRRARSQRSIAAVKGVTEVSQSLARKLKVWRHFYMAGERTPSEPTIVTSAT
jgi:hypothetical protein